LLREKLEDPISGISEETVGAVAMMAVVERGKRNMMATKMHIDVLKRIIKLEAD